MPRLKIGRVTFAFKGEWNGLTDYERLDTVTWNGSSWVAKIDVPKGVEPSLANDSYWAVGAQRGETGAQGPAGDAENLTWDMIGSKPQTATRWPTFGEVNSVPQTATRWPTWDEVSNKPSSFPVDAESHDHKRIVDVPAGSVPFDNASRNPREFFNVGLCVTFVEDSYGWPIPFGKLLNIPSFSASQDGGAMQILVPYSSAYNSGKVMKRVGRFDNNGWSDWVTEASTGDVDSAFNTLSLLLSEKLESDDFNAANILSLLAPVSAGEGGVNANLLQGKSPSDFYSPENPPPAGAVVDTSSVLNAYKGAGYKAVGSYATGTSKVNYTLGSGQSGSSLGLSSGSWRIMGIASVVENQFSGSTITFLALRYA